ncbi:MAG: hypothetical protein IJW44_00695 [Clostridia bacterium]|nr:hypothetical protein [Clostridia bacterium]
MKKFYVEPSLQTILIDTTDIMTGSSTVQTDPADPVTGAPGSWDDILQGIG